MSPLLGFTTMRDLIENGTKRQTIRLARKQPIKVGDTLYLYWKLRTKECELIGTTRCSLVDRLSWGTIAVNSVLARQDGFLVEERDISNIRASQWDAGMRIFQDWFESRYHPTDDTEFDIIRWKFPLWNEGELRPASRRVKP